MHLDGRIDWRPVLQIWRGDVPSDVAGLLKAQHAKNYLNSKNVGDQLALSMTEVHYLRSNQKCAQYGRKKIVGSWNAIF